MNQKDLMRNSTRLEVIDRNQCLSTFYIKGQECRDGIDDDENDDDDDDNDDDDTNDMATTPAIGPMTYEY